MTSQRDISRCTIATCQGQNSMRHVVRFLVPFHLDYGDGWIFYPSIYFQGIYCVPSVNQTLCSVPGDIHDVFRKAWGVCCGVSVHMCKLCHLPVYLYSNG